MIYIFSPWLELVVEATVMSYRKFKSAAEWLSILLAAASLATISYVKIRFVFDSGNLAALLVSISLAAGLLALVLGLVSLPRWRGGVALVIVAFVAYLVVFTRLYGLS